MFFSVMHRLFNAEGSLFIITWLLIFLDLPAADKWQLHIIAALKLALKQVTNQLFHLIDFPHTLFTSYSSYSPTYSALSSSSHPYVAIIPLLSHVILTILTFQSASLNICVTPQVFSSVFSPVLSLYTWRRLGLSHLPDLSTCLYLALLLALTPAFLNLSPFLRVHKRRSLYFPQQLSFVLRQADKSC